MAFRSWWLALLVLLHGLLAPEGHAVAADAPSPDRSLAPYFVVQGADPSIDTLPLRSTKVDVAVSGVVAAVTVTQRYENAGKRPLSAEYVFPASTRAAVNGMKMAIGNQVIVAKIKEREAAKREYEAHKEEGKNAALLEQQRPNVFTMRVANVMPGDGIDVTLRYTELLVPTGGEYELVYPTVVGPRYSNVSADKARSSSRFVATPFLREGVTPPSTFELSGTLSSGIPVQAVTSPSHTLTSAWDNVTLVRFAVAGKKENDRDFVLRYSLAGDQIQSGLSLHDGGAEKTFLLVVQPPKKVTPAQIPAREYVFILDVSGSMTGFPLDTAKRLLRELASGLRPIDRFNVLLFSGATHLMAEAAVPATRENIEKALETIDQERGGGGTELLPALQQALTLKAAAGTARSFIVMTDGFIEADREAITLVRQNLSKANVFSFGIGSSVNRFLVEGLARAGEGEPFVVTDPSEAAAVAHRFHDYVASPVLSHVQIAFDGFDTYDVEPRTVPDVLADRPVVVQGKWRGKPGGTVTLRGTTGAGPYTQRFDVSTVTPRAENHALPQLWARTRIASLSDFGFGEPDAARKADITALGLRYDLLTAYTSFIAVSEVVRTKADGDDVTQPSVLPLGVSELAVAEDMMGAPEPELVVLLAACAVLGGLLGLGRRGLRIGVAS